jgi:hypothetical protein
MVSNNRAIIRRFNMDRVYLDKLDKKYFKNCISEVIQHYEIEGINPEVYLQRMEDLSIQISGLRDTFFVFGIDDILELKTPVQMKIEELKLVIKS